MSKEKGQVFTPNWIVKEMIKFSDIKDITKLKVIDNACGDGAFICEIVKQIIKAKPKNIKKVLEENVAGIELDQTAYKMCLVKLKVIEKEFNLPKIKWNIENANTLKVYKKYENKFDLVIGNPPYVRIHNTVENLSSFKFCNKGMTDLFLAFYEIGLKMLKKDGKLCYINPSSIFNSKASETARDYIVKEKLLTKVINFKHQQLFDKITTYSTVLLLDSANKQSTIDYYECGFNNPTRLSYDDFVINNFWYFSKSIKNLKSLKEIINNKKPQKIKAKNGVATLCDKVLINDNLPDSKYTLKIIKASTLKQTKTLFLYDDNFLPITFNDIPEKIKDYLLKNKKALKNRDLENKDLWWVYGRTQAIKDKNYAKICINTTIKDLKSIKIKKTKEGELVYSGLYLMIDNNSQEQKIKKIICNQNFIDYITMLGKYKAGGYYTFNTKDLSNYLNYYL
ncbi:class I SAM-dependent DNA methyltransferase [Mycoplasma sp. E35C]|uniref:HsdM family class I SAM-dependent methyltransferase n=1 Tax=Mycoplasma sp. E35C TaxID=2801918 RepID=UPI001CA3E3EE|nr:N-6 DNA methylase [Mycoplasma sp. E35C]QZX49305.1 Eco57I restriction-modification methylase domain-containing protein [Mycoplasma sp. E35C]